MRQNKLHSSVSDQWSVFAQTCFVVNEGVSVLRSLKVQTYQAREGVAARGVVIIQHAAVSSNPEFSDCLHLLVLLSVVG